MNTNGPDLRSSTKEAAGRKKRGPVVLVGYAVLGIALAAILGWGAISLSGHSAKVASAQAAPAAVTQAASASSQGTSPASAPTAVSPAQAVAAKLGPSVVNIKVTAGSQGGTAGTQQYSAEGSGVIYSSDGSIITNNHVVTTDGTQRVDTVEVTLATGEVLPARIIGTDPLTDLAVIKVTPTKALPVAAFLGTQPTVGEYAIAIGSPLGYANSVTLGIVSGTGRSISQATGQEALALVDLLQTDAAISPGNSGGALADSAGQVIGINVAYLPPGQTGAENVGFAIPAEVATGVADQLVKTGKASHVYLGVSTETITPELKQQFGLSSSVGALVAQVSPNTPAAKAGLKQGDVITKIDSKAITSGSDVLVALRDKSPGEQTQITVERGGQTLAFAVTLEERPAGV
jgi:S1-C subfamily serine protease